MKRSFYHPSRGYVLASTLIILLSLTLIAVTVAYRNTIDEMMAGNQRDAINAMTIAESGEAKAWELLKAVIADEDAVNITYFSGNPACGTKIPIETDVEQSSGEYNTHLWLHCLDRDGKQIPEPLKYDFGDLLVINSVGSVNGAEREIETIYLYTAVKSRHAILTQDDIELRGEMQILEDYAYVHSNSDVRVTGQATVDQTVSASGAVTIEGADAQLLGSPGTVQGAGAIEIPYVNPLEFRDQATIVLTWDCRVLDASGTQLATVPTNTKWHGWECNQALNLWKMGSAAGGATRGPLSAYYYVEGNVEVGSSSSDHRDFASSCTQELDGGYCWLVSIVAEGNIAIGGDFDMQPYAPPLLFLSGNDIRLRGSAAQSLDGLVAAHQEVEIAGQFSMKGSVIAENGLWGAGQQVTENRVVTDLVAANLISGSGKIVKDEISDTPFSYTLQMAWRELVN